MHRLFSVVFLSWLVFLASPNLSNSEEVDICIIGAGPSGVQAAYTANEKGYSFKVIEKNSYVGGKTKLVRLEGQEDDPYPLGAVVHFYDHDSSVGRLLKEFDIDTFPLPTPQYMDENGSTDLNIRFFRSFRVVYQYISFFIRRVLLGNKLDNPDAFLSDYPKSLNMPFYEWLDENGMGGLKQIAWRIFTPHGYGDFNLVPAIYPLRTQTVQFLIGVVIDQIILLLFPNHEEGYLRVQFQDLLQAMAGTLPDSSVVLGANITEVDYGDSDSTNTTIYYSTANGNISISCASTVIAFSQTLNTMKDIFIPPDASGLEELLAQVQTENYYSILLQDEDENYQVFRDMVYLEYQPNGVPDNPALNTLVARYLERPGTSIVAYYLSPSDKTDEEALRESFDHYEKLIGKRLNVTEVVQVFDYWPTYFPHVLQEALDDGFYPKFDSLQGVDGQYYVGGLFNFETVQTSMQHAEHIINRFF